MADVFSATAPERRIVLLGKARTATNGVVELILGDTEQKEEFERCFIYEGEQAGKRICIVDAPGWDRTSIDKTTKKINNEITRSVTLCPPGPHALILVLPINTDDGTSVNELKSACRHMELLSERVWNYIIVLFLCDGDVEESRVKDHIQNAEKLLQQCRGRHYVMRNRERKTQVHGLIKEIDSMIEDNLGDFFLPQVYYEVVQSKIPKDIRELKKSYEGREEMLKQGYQKRLSAYKKQAEEVTVLNQRRGSFNINHPSFKEDEQQVLDVDAIKSKYRDEIQTLAKHYLKPIGLLVMAIIGALIGSVVGSYFGVIGAGVGIITGIVVAVPLSLLLINAASLARNSSTLVKQEKYEHTD